MLEQFSRTAESRLSGDRLSFPVGEEGDFIEVDKYPEGWVIISHCVTKNRVTSGMMGGCMSATTLERLVRQFVTGNQPPARIVLGRGRNASSLLSAPRQGRSETRFPMSRVGPTPLQSATRLQGYFPETRSLMWAPHKHLNGKGKRLKSKSKKEFFVIASVIKVILVGTQGKVKSAADTIFSLS